MKVKAILVVGLLIVAALSGLIAVSSRPTHAADPPRTVLAQPRESSHGPLSAQQRNVRARPPRLQAE